MSLQVPALEKYGTNSVIAVPATGSTLSSRTFTARGYAISSGESAIAKVEVLLLTQSSSDEDMIAKADQSTEWKSANLEGEKHKFAWTLWNIELTVPEEVKAGQKVVVVARAGQLGIYAAD